MNTKKAAEYFPPPLSTIYFAHGGSFDQRWIVANVFDIIHTASENRFRQPDFSKHAIQPTIPFIASFIFAALAYIK